MKTIFATVRLFFSFLCQYSKNLVRETFELELIVAAITKKQNSQAVCPFKRF